MRSRSFLSLLFLAIVVSIQSPAAVRYVDQNCATPMPPYTDWNTAATNIQEAIDVATAGDVLLVTNGVYATGGRVIYGSLTNRVAADKPVMIQSVNGPVVTAIEGYQVPVVRNGDAAVRCVYLTNGAFLAGFTLTNGATRDKWGVFAESRGGGVWCESTDAGVSNCVIAANVSAYEGAGACSGTLRDCRLIENTNIHSGGGGAAFSVLIDCTLERNQGCSVDGGGALSCMLTNCVLSGNRERGARNCILDNCLVTGNVGNGLVGGLANQCTISSNIAPSTVFAYRGGGARDAKLTRCVLYANEAPYGGGAYNCELYSCVLSNNHAHWDGGGVFRDVETTNQIGADNMLIGNIAGRNGGGCSVGGPASILVNWSFISNSAAVDGGGCHGGFPILDSAFIGNVAGQNGGGACTESSTVCSNSLFEGNIAGTNGGGIFSAKLRYCTLIGNQAVNGGGTCSGGMNDCVVVGNVATVNGGGLFVLQATEIFRDCTFTNNSAGTGGGIYDSSAAIFSNFVFSGNAALSAGGGLFDAGSGWLKDSVLVNNRAGSGGGGYDGNYTNCLFIGNSAATNGGGLWLRSITSPARACVLVSNSAAGSGGGVFGGALKDSVLSGNSAGASGGGVCSATVSYCILSSNQTAGNGGAAYGSSLANCLLIGNAASYGGGAYCSSGNAVNNSTLAGNQATNAGGGLYHSAYSTVSSSIAYYNSAASNANFSGPPAVLYTYSACCVVPLPASGTGNITNEPAFINLVAGNLRLQTNSPCINTGGGNPGGADLDGRPRAVGGRIDMGAYEFQGAGMGEFIAWLQQYRLPHNGTADHTDTDIDDMDNWQEWRARTDPTNAASLLLLFDPAPAPTGLWVSWRSVDGVTYFLERSAGLELQPAFSAIESNLVGQADSTVYADTNAIGPGPFFYRVGVQ